MSNQKQIKITLPPNGKTLRLIENISEYFGLSAVDWCRNAIIKEMKIDSEKLTREQKNED